MKIYIVFSLLAFAFYGHAYSSEFERLIMTGDVSDAGINENDISNRDSMGKPRKVYAIGKVNGKLQFVEGKVNVKKWEDKRNLIPDRIGFTFIPDVPNTKLIHKYLFIGKID